MEINLLPLEDLVKLRKQITLKSQDLSDYKNTLGVDPKQAREFFNVYYIETLKIIMEYDGHDASEFDSLLEEYDNEKSLDSAMDYFCGYWCM